MNQKRVLEKFGLVTIVLISFLLLGFSIWWQLALTRQLNDGFVKNTFPANIPPDKEPDGLKDYLAYATLEKERIIAENAVRTTLFTAIGGLFFIITAYFSWENLKISKKTLKATEDKQIAERYNEAVKLLAHEKKHVHLGGIYALGKIADTEEYYYEQAMEMLTAYVRENAPYQAVSEETLPKLPQTNIQAVLTILSKSRRKRAEQGKKSFRPDLHQTDLSYIKIGSRDDLSGAIFEGTNLRKANLRSVNLKRTNLKEANLEGTNLIEADLEGTNLKEANLEEANLTRANLKGANLKGANLKGANLKSANLKFADLSQAQNLKLEQVESASCKEGTRLPSELQ